MSVIPARECVKVLDSEETGPDFLDEPITEEDHASPSESSFYGIDDEISPLEIAMAEVSSSAAWPWMGMMVPEKMVTDNAPYFTSDMLKEIRCEVEECCVDLLAFLSEIFPSSFQRQNAAVRAEGEAKINTFGCFSHV